VISPRCTWPCPGWQGQVERRGRGGGGEKTKRGGGRKGHEGCVEPNDKLHLVSLSLSLCPRTPSTPLPLCRSFSHPPLHFGPLHQRGSPPGVKSVLCVVCLAFGRLTSGKIKTGCVVIVHFRTFGREIFMQVIHFGWFSIIPHCLGLPAPPPSCFNNIRPARAPPNSTTAKPPCPSNFNSTVPAQQQRNACAGAETFPSYETPH
jgi:hypothetical protein